MHNNNNSIEPLITVAMPIFNAGKYLLPAVTSIINQSYLNWELVIVDDGSTDNSLKSIYNIKDPRIKIISDGQNLGLCKRLNQIIDISKGKYFARMDQDDISYPNRFAAQIDILKNNSTIDLVGVKTITFSTDNDPVGYLKYFENHEDITSRPWHNIYLPHPTWMGKTSWFRHHKYYSPAPFLCEDQELLLRAFSSSKYYSVNKILFAYRLKNRKNLKSLVKLARNRYSLFLIFGSFFIKKFQPINFVLAFLSLFLGVVKDFSWGLSDYFNIRGPEYGKSERYISDNDIIEFSKVLKMSQHKNRKV